jgi:hypothetical protein
VNPITILIYAFLVATCLALLSTDNHPAVASAFAAGVGCSAVLARLFDVRLRWFANRETRVGIARYVLPLDYMPLAAVAIFKPAELPLVGGITSGIDDRATVKAMLIIGAATLTALYASSLVDRYYILPRVSGGHWRGQMPCCDDHLRWKRVTRTWLLHRLLANLLFVGGGAVVLTVGVTHWVRGDEQTVATVVAAAATVLAGFYLTRTAPAIAQVVNPWIQVGDTIQLAEEFNVPAEAEFPKYYVVDVSLEGVKLRDLAGARLLRERSAPPRRTHDRVIDIPEISKLLRSRPPGRPCTGRREGCKAVNPYCPYVREAAAAAPRPTTEPGSPMRTKGQPGVELSR